MKRIAQKAILFFCLLLPWRGAKDGVVKEQEYINTEEDKWFVETQIHGVK